MGNLSGRGPAVQNRFVNALRPDTLRLAVGLEDPADLIAYIRAAIDTALPA